MILAMLTRLALALVASCALAAGAQTLVLGTKLELNTLDPHFFASFPTGSSHEYLYDRLVVLDDKLRIQPALATSWRLIDDYTGEFKLDKGVTFHDGSPFPPDGVNVTR